MVIVVCPNCSVRGILNVMDHLSMGIVELLLYDFLICVLRDCLCVSLEAMSVALWTQAD